MLSDTEVLKAIKNSKIRIEPFDPIRLGSVSYDLTTFVVRQWLSPLTYHLETKEVITVDRDILGICSMRSRGEREGLISSGSLLVDPGYTGKLHFIVYRPESNPWSHNLMDLFQIMFLEVKGKVKVAYNERGKTND